MCAGAGANGFSAVNDRKRPAIPCGEVLGGVVFENDGLGADLEGFFLVAEGISCKFKLAVIIVAAEAFDADCRGGRGRAVGGFFAERL